MKNYRTKHNEEEGNQNCKGRDVIKNEKGISLTAHCLRIHHCHCSSLGHCCGADSIPGTSACHRSSQKKEREGKGSKSGNKKTYFPSSFTPPYSPQVLPLSVLAFKHTLPGALMLIYTKTGEGQRDSMHSHLMHKSVFLEESVAPFSSHKPLELAMSSGRTGQLLPEHVQSSCFLLLLFIF